MRYHEDTHWETAPCCPEGTVKSRLFYTLKSRPNV